MRQHGIDVIVVLDALRDRVPVDLPLNFIAMWWFRQAEQDLVESQVWRGHGRSSSRACLKSPCAEESLQRPRSAGYTKESVHALPVSNSSHACEGASARNPASLQDNGFSNGILGKTPQSIFSAIFEDQLNGFDQTVAALFGCAPLAVSPRDLRTVGDEPFFVLLYDRGELIVHSETSTSCTVVYLILAEKSSTLRRTGERTA